MARYSPLFRLACKALKYYLLALFGFTVSCLLGMMLGALPLISPMLPIATTWFLRLAIATFCLLATAIIAESIRQ